MAKPKFECPICDSLRFDEIPPLDPADRSTRSYGCTCCGFVFNDPSRYKPRLTPYSTIRVPPAQG
jgi:hypothetical protein